jgi:4-diphosphocytidyl-2-C-methyl-D-erythritol kinase
MSTPLAYRTLDEKYNNFVNYVPKLSMLDILTSADTSTSISQYCEGLYNIFEEVVENMRPDVTRVKSIMVQKGAVRSMMSGSGTSVFGIFEDENDANAALYSLRDIGADTHICYPCDNSEQLIPE